MKITTCLGMAAMAFALVLGGCGDEETEPISHGDRCVAAEQSVKACVQAFCEKGTAQAFCDCFANGGHDLGDGCQCSFSTVWYNLKEEHCEINPTPTGKVPCKALKLEQRYGGTCGS